jgi:hypothetical protein
LDSPPNINRKIKSRRIKWARKYTFVGRRGKYTGIWYEDLKKKGNYEDLDAHRRVTFNRV